MTQKVACSPLTTHQRDITPARFDGFFTTMQGGGGAGMMCSSGAALKLLRPYSG